MGLTLPWYRNKRLCLRVDPVGCSAMRRVLRQCDAKCVHGFVVASCRLPAFRYCLILCRPFRAANRGYRMDVPYLARIRLVKRHDQYVLNRQLLALGESNPIISCLRATRFRDLQRAKKIRSL